LIDLLNTYRHLSMCFWVGLLFSSRQTSPTTGTVNFYVTVQFFQSYSRLGRLALYCTIFHCNLNAQKVLKCFDSPKVASTIVQCPPHVFSAFKQFTLVLIPPLFGTPLSK